MNPVRKARGFTLVEMLIVIAIIGILSGSLMLTMGAGTDKAEASRIVSDLNSLKLAAGLYYADNLGGEMTPSVDALKPYMSAHEALSGGRYEFLSGQDAGQWFVGCDVSDASAGVRQRLKKMAAANGLRCGVTSSDADVYDGGSQGVYVRVR
jgi:general secretion pathway protein G